MEKVVENERKPICFVFLKKHTAGIRYNIELTSMRVKITGPKSGQRSKNITFNRKGK